MFQRHWICLVAWIAMLAGCGVNRATSTSSQRDSVTNQGGKGTGTVAGVHIEVLGLTQKNAAVTHSFELAQGGEKNSQRDRWEVELGEVQLILQRTGGGPISLTVDGQSFGTVHEDDQLTIDADRRVLINGKQRSAQ